ncbi:MAG TPA: TSUP family transporter [Actinomycetes bacterium]|nr:TSUP family transporter [Actinomycetes bacterium]
MPDLEVVLLLVAAAAAAGWFDAVSGGGGLIQLPALLVLLPGASPAQVLATNKLSGVCGTSVAAGTYYRRVHPDLRTALPMAAVAFVGAAAGAACASLMPEELFRPLVLVLLVAVGSYVLTHPGVGDEQNLRWDGRRHHLAAAAGGLGIGFYDGIFGPGTGAFLVFLFVSLLGYSFLQGSAKARIVNLATNLGALLVFIPQGAPLWRLGLLMGAANVAGGWIGAHTAIRRGSRFVRVVFLVVVGGLVLKLGIDVVQDAAS